MQSAADCYSAALVEYYDGSFAKAPKREDMRQRGPPSGAVELRFPAKER